MRFLPFAAVGLLASLVSQAQDAPRHAKVSQSAAAECAAARQHSALRQPVHTVRHRQKMERYDLNYYKLDVSLTNTTLDIGGSVRLRARNVSGQALDSLAFELYSTFTIDSVVVDGRRSSGWRRSAGDVTARIPQPITPNALFYATVYYRGTAPSGGSAAIGNGLDNGSSPTYGTQVTWSLSEPFSAYEWFPCKQVLTDKIDSVEVWATTDRPNKVGSNGLLRNTVLLPNNKVRYEWKTKYPIDYYLISVACAPYIQYDTPTTLPDGRVVPVVHYIYNNQVLTDQKSLIDLTPAMINNFSSLVVAYPFANEKYGHSMGPIGGGMEHQTMTTQQNFSFTLTAHELFHQWFGDNVTCAQWQDIWLNESFATYGEYLTLGPLSSASDARDWMNGEHSYVMSQPGGSIRVPDADSTNVGRIFDSRLTYAKGATVIHMLRYLLNDDTKFFRALRTYQTTYAGRTAYTRDLVRIFEAEAGRSLTYFFQQWFYGQGFPSFSVRWNQVGSNFYLRSTETASMPTVTPFFDTDVDYLLRFASGQTLKVRRRQAQAVTDFGVQLPAGQTVSSVEVDPDQWILNGTGTIQRDNALVLATAAAQRTERIQVYPNPAHAVLTLSSLPAPSVQAEVTDAIGRVVLRQTLTGTTPQLNVASLRAGLYQLRLLTNGQAVQFARFVKE
ncbi:T9SS type A sorting domain-containing protein [Hymenobacter busanensis]|uniref:Aminopeptidase N n=1 Tax=Hymenobacter busanensis TaxID=2607656 RepID=A0A7L4ZU99_9BACT|nr:M1 family aminopeptidase [Hymenobacter busanensis]KAA9339743.1 T9SS type A sorting domain-containing protein [Hymenobacter busanensis]QHJ06503.1 T9SS type A sorting domain-containing protein [Hymenobacter busanensis]